jgi:hypothetical protein
MASCRWRSTGKANGDEPERRFRVEGPQVDSVRCSTGRDSERVERREAGTGVRGGGQKGGVQSTSHLTRPGLRRGLVKSASGISRETTWNTTMMFARLRVRQRSRLRQPQWRPAHHHQDYHTLLLPHHVGCVVKQRGANL